MTDANAARHAEQVVDQHADLTDEQKADSDADLKVTLLIFATLVAIAVMTISGWSPQF